MIIARCEPLFHKIKIASASRYFEIATGTSKTGKSISIAEVDLRFFGALNILTLEP